MKNWKTRLLSLLLTLALSISMLGVFAFASDEDVAEDGDEGENVHSPIVNYNRTFDEGWGIYNGTGNAATIEKGHNYFVDSEVTLDYSRNYFARFEASDSLLDGFAQLDYLNQGNPATQHVYIEFDIKIDDNCNLGTILYYRTRGAATLGTSENLLAIKDNQLVLFPGLPESVSVSIGDEWKHVVIDFDYTQDRDEAWEFDISITFDETVSTTRRVRVKTEKHVGLDLLRFGLANVSSVNEALKRQGQSYCIDNLQSYMYTDRRLTQEEINAQGYGENVNENQIKDVIIDGSSAGKTIAEYVEESICMKIGVNYALLNGKQVNIIDGTYGAPAVYEGKIVVPFDIILEYLNTGYYIHEDGKSYDISTGVSATYITMGRDLATVDGKVVSLTMAPGYYTDELTGNKYAVVALDDIETLLPGYYVTYDDMGLIVIGRIDNMFNRENDLTAMMELMNRFIYNYIDEEEVYERAEELTNGFTHPYVLGGQEVYDRMIAIYNGTDTREYDVDLKKYITAQVDRSYALYNALALPDPLLDSDGNVMTDEEGKVLYGNTHDYYHGINWDRPDTKTLLYPHIPTNGYDPAGGRQAESGTVTNWAYDIAFGYIITGDIKLAQLTYDILVEVGEWNHWCPGHFLNTADAAKSYAIALDWIYNGIVALGEGEYDTTVEAPGDRAPSEYYDVTYLEKLLYKNGVRMGYLASTLQHHGWTRPQGDVYYYTTMTNNWNAVCTSGMWISALVLMGSDIYGELGTGEGEAPVKQTSAWLIANNIESMAKYGMGQYAPDGSYVESPGYWGYGTNSLYFGLMALWRCLGDDFGFFDAPGMDKTCYFACSAESSDYRQFSYHDAGVGATVDTVSFYFVAEAMNDPVLAEIRKLHNNGGKGMNIKDFLFYPYDSEDSDGEVVLPLDYYMEGIDAFVSRSSWEKGSLYAGIIGGDNNASHGQIDSGTFVYHNGGREWISDIGSDEYNIYHYFTKPERYRYYRMNAEGHNVVALVSQTDKVPYGQTLMGFGELTDWLSNDFGSYAIIDNTSVYGGIATIARRGMLVTNNRKTVVIQDEINLAGVETLYWCAQFFNDTLDPEILGNGRTLILHETDGKGLRTGRKVRLAIVSNTSYEKFVITSAGETEEDRLIKGDLGTVDYGYSTSMGALVSEKSRSNISRITIKANSNTMNLAVVIEMVDNINDPLGYSRFTSMSEWEPTGTIQGGNNDEEIPTRPKPNLSNLNGYVRSLSSNVESGRQFGSRFEQYYSDLANVYYTTSGFYPEELFAYTEQLDKYEQFKAEYDSYIGKVNEVKDAAKALAQMLMGV